MPIGLRPLGSRAIGSGPVGMVTGPAGDSVLYFACYPAAQAAPTWTPGGGWVPAPVASVSEQVRSNTGIQVAATQFTGLTPGASYKTAAVVSDGVTTGAVAYGEAWIAQDKAPTALSVSASNITASGARATATLEGASPYRAGDVYLAVAETADTLTWSNGGGWAGGTVVYQDGPETAPTDTTPHVFTPDASGLTDSTAHKLWAVWWDGSTQVGPYASAEFSTLSGAYYQDSSVSSSSVSTVGFTAVAISASTVSAESSASSGLIGAAVNQSALSAAGSSTMGAAGKTIFAAYLTSAGLSEFVPNGQAVATGAFAAGGGSTASWLTGASGYADAVFAADGASTSAFSGQALAASTLTSAGGSTVGMAGQALAAAVLNSQGSGSLAWSATASGFVDATVLSSGSAAAAWAATAVASSVYSASGASTTSWLTGATGFADASFSAAGATSVAFVGRYVSKSSLAAAGATSAIFVGRTVLGAALGSASAASVTFGAKTIASASVAAPGSSSANLITGRIVSASVYSAGTTSVNFISDGTVIPDDVLPGTSVFIRLMPLRHFIRPDSADSIRFGRR